MPKNHYPNLSINAFREELTKGRIVDVEAVGREVHFKWACGKEGLVVKASGLAKRWPSGLSANSFVAMKRVEIELNSVMLQKA